MNNGRIGGAVLILSADSSSQTVLIENSIFSENVAGNGGAVGLDGNFLALYALIQNNFFYGNLASCTI